MSGSCRLHEYREKVKERTKAVEAEEEKQRLRGQVLGKKVDGPNVNAFLRQLGPDSVSPQVPCSHSCNLHCNRTCIYLSGLLLAAAEDASMAH